MKDSLEPAPITLAAVAPSRPSTLGSRVLVAIWFVAAALVSASLLARHLVALPVPAAAQLGRALGAFRPVAPGSLGVVHVLYAECRCSKLIAEHLVTRARPGGIVEHVVLVGKDDILASSLAAHGFVVELASAERLAAWGIEAAPIFVVLSLSGEVRYAGGYTERKQGLFPRDREIVAAVRAGDTVAPLPVFGCAVSAGIERSINPLRLP